MSAIVKSAMIDDFHSNLIQNTSGLGNATKLNLFPSQTYKPHRNKMRKYIYGSGVTHHPCFVVVQNADQGTCKNPRKELLGYNKGHAVNLSWNETGIRGI